MFQTKICTRYTYLEIFAMLKHFPFFSFFIWQHWADVSVLIARWSSACYKMIRFIRAVSSGPIWGLHISQSYMYTSTCTCRWQSCIYSHLQDINIVNGTRGATKWVIVSKCDDRFMIGTSLTTLRVPMDFIGKGKEEWGTAWYQRALNKGAYSVAHSWQIFPTFPKLLLFKQEIRQLQIVQIRKLTLNYRWSELHPSKKVTQHHFDRNSNQFMGLYSPC